MSIFSMTLQDDGRELTLERRETQTVMDVSLQQKLSQAIAKTANTIVKNYGVRHHTYLGVHQRKSRRSKGPGSGSPLQICSSVNIRVRMRSAL